MTLYKMQYDKTWMALAADTCLLWPCSAWKHPLHQWTQASANPCGARLAEAETRAHRSRPLWNEPYLTCCCAPLPSSDGHGVAETNAERDILRGPNRCFQTPQDTDTCWTFTNVRCKKCYTCRNLALNMLPNSIFASKLYLYKLLCIKLFNTGLRSHGTGPQHWHGD